MPATSLCWKCHKETGELSQPLGFRAECPHCGVDLHACINCRYFSLGKPNHCLVPGTERIIDRERANFCEDFKVKLPESPSSSRKHPFGTWDDPPSPKNFDSLFKD